MKHNYRQIAGIILWWTEGTKAYKDKRWKNAWIYNVDVTNTNPKIIRTFVDFLRKDIGIEEDRLKLQLQIHEGDDQRELENYWSKITNIQKEQFTKTIVRPRGNKVGKSRGTCKIRYSDKKIYNKLNDLLIEIISKIDKNNL